MEETLPQDAGSTPTDLFVSPLLTGSGAKVSTWAATLPVVVTTTCSQDELLGCTDVAVAAVGLNSAAKVLADDAIVVCWALGKDVAVTICDGNMLAESETGT